ncbi:MAG: type II secretion system protein GspD [Verrucomicrobiae bacterium]|nr:type II secretion system protein GspD [Verrucomicrobiae bacterium]
MTKMTKTWRNRGLAGMLGALLLTLGSASAQHLVQSSPAYELEAARLRSAPSSKYEFNRALLRDVLRFLADDSGISYIGLPEENESQTVFVTFNITASPFSALETVANTHGVALVFGDGVWHMRPLDDKQMISRSYQLKYNTHEQYDSNGSGAGGATSGGGGGAGGAGGGLPSTGLSSSTEKMFEPNVDQLLESLKQLLGIPTNGWEANRAPGTDVDSFGSTPMKMPASTVQFQKSESENGAQVIYVSDSNAIYVVATRQQHQWVEGFLETADRPQPLIAVEVKFFETSKNPSKQLGLDWTSVLGDGYNFDIADGNTGGRFTDLAKLTKGGLEIKGPDTALLSADDASFTIRALRSDQETTSVSYPRVVTMNNREVVINSVVNQPVLSSSTSTNSGVGGTNTQQIEYLPVGTIINVLPKIMADNEVQMLVAITVSDIVGSESIGGNAYPIVSSRIYTAPLRVESGYTVAIAGLDEARDSETEFRVPVLGKIPVLKNLFGDYDRRRNKKNLMIFITPTILESKSHGLEERVKAEVPITHDDPLQSAPQIYPDGELAGGIESLGEAVLWADRESRRLEQVLKESRDDKETYREIRRLKALCDSLLSWIDSTGANHPGYADRLSVHKWSLARMAQRCMKMQLEYGKNRLATDI